MDVLKRYFYGYLSSSEEEQVRQWLVLHSDDPQVQETLLALMVQGREDDYALSSGAYAAVCRKLGMDMNARAGDRKRKVLKWLAYVTACLLLPVLGMAVHGIMAPRKDVVWTEVNVPEGHTEEVTLSDGTVLQLNAGTRLTYPSEFTGTRRVVFVEGEVFAKVAGNPECPFILSAPDVDVEVLGTVFNFKAYDGSDCVELLLMEGAVRMDIGRDNLDRSIEVCPGEMVQYDRRSSEIEIRNFNPSGYRGFHEGGSVHFFNLPLSDIVADLERLFSVKMVILDETLAHARYFALFTNGEPLEKILEGLNADGRMKFAKKDGVIYVSRK